MKVIALLALVAFVAIVESSVVLKPSSNTAVIPFQYPVFKQCNATWAKNLIVNETVCAVGCLMSSISSAIAGHSIRIPDGSAPGGFEDANPGSLNAFLRENGGYDEDNDLDEDVCAKVNPDHISWVGKEFGVTIDTLRQWLDDKRVVIANVMHGGHFVLMIGYEPSNPDLFYVMDPGFDRESYNYSDMVGWRLFDMKLE